MSIMALTVERVEMMSLSRFKLPWASGRTQTGSEDPGNSARRDPAKGAGDGTAGGGAAAKITPIRSIGVQLFLYFVVIVIAAVAAVGYLSYDVSRNLIEQQAENSARLTAVQAAEKLQLVLQQYDEITLELLLLPEIEDVVQAYRVFRDDALRQLETRRALNDRLNTYTFSNSAIYGIYLLSLDPALPTITNGTTLPSNEVKEKAWFQRAVEEDGKSLLVPT